MCALPSHDPPQKQLQEGFFWGGEGFWLKMKNTLETLIAEEVCMYLNGSWDDEKGAIIPLVDTKLVHAGGVAHFQLNYPGEDSIT